MSVTQVITRLARSLALAAALVAIGPAAHSQQPSAAAMATAKDIVGVTGATALFNPLIPGVIEQAKILFLQQDPSLSQDLNEIGTRLRSELMPRLTELSDEMAKLYATHFTETELKEILAFYKSPVGKKMLAQQPAVIDSSMKYAQTWSTKLSDEVVAKLRTELKKKGHNL